ncbi:Serine/threonine-protein kinase wnk3 [Physocladia obscura]|uniref:non-specific serine/threonine protein kinase n=1 Tax=Physocladia obscura TaxID=109957 RepID=A0AAD5SX34_9FUNG|nr:Serine/threonine-protein kinase wnk3 [Physocladia obscura]
MSNILISANSSSLPTLHADFSKNNNDEDADEDDENKVIETDPTGRFSRYKKLLGKGAYKEVYKGFDEDEGVEVAWNQLRVDHLDKREAQRILSEIQILKSLRSENIITIYHAWGAKGKDGRERVFFITELMTAGTLKSYLKKSSKAAVATTPAPLTSVVASSAPGSMNSLHSFFSNPLTAGTSISGGVRPVIKKWCRQILQGLCYLHSRTPPIIHRNGVAKIGDLGLAIPKSKDHASSVLGTPEFMAPELYDGNYDEKVDIYAFGMVVLEMVTKEYPYSECTNQYQIYKKVSSGVKPEALAKVTDEQTVQFIELCIQFLPSRRPSAADLLMHPFLKAPEFISNTTATPIATGGSKISIDSESAVSSKNSEILQGLMTDGEKTKINVDPDRYTISPQTSGGTVANPPVSNPDISAGKSLSITSVTYADSHPLLLANLGMIPSPPASNTPSLAGPVSNIANILSITTPTAATPMQSTVIIELFDRHSESTVTLRMIYTSALTRQTYDFRFPFNLPEDTSTDVVSEMVKENLIEAQDEALARRKLEEKVKHILLGRLEESSRRTSEVPNSSLQIAQSQAKISDTALRNEDAFVNQKYATVPRTTSGTDIKIANGLTSVEKPYSTLPRANSSAADINFVPRVESGSSMSSSAESSLGVGSAETGGRISPEKIANLQIQQQNTFLISPQPVQKLRPQSHLSVEDQANRVNAAMTANTFSLSTKQVGNVAVASKLFRPTESIVRAANEGASPELLPLFSISEGHKRGNSGSSGDFQLSSEVHIRRSSQLSSTSDQCTPSLSSVEIAETRPGSQQTPQIVSPLPINPITQQNGVIKTQTPGLIVYGPENRPGNSTTPPGSSNSAANVAAQQKLLELQERSLKDLGSSSTRSPSNTSTGGPHINHHVVHQYPVQFHPHHAASYSGIVPQGNNGVSRAAANLAWIQNGVTNSVRPSMSATSSAVSQNSGMLSSKLSSATGSSVGTPASGMSPNFSEIAGRSPQQQPQPQPSQQRQLPVIQPIVTRVGSVSDSIPARPQIQAGNEMGSILSLAGRKGSS